MEGHPDRRLRHRVSPEDERRLGQIAGENEEQQAERVALDGEAVGAWLQRALEQAQRAEQPSYVDALCCFSLAAGVRCLLELAIVLLDDEAAPEDLRLLAVQLRPRGPAWDGAARLAAWGYFAEFAQRNVPAQYAEAIEQATAAMPVRPDTCAQVIAFGPLSAEEPELFHTRLARLIVREARGPDDLRGSLELQDGWWAGAWAVGWEAFRELHEHHFPPED